MTVTEYSRYEPPPGFRDELIEGELILSPSPNARHADLCHRLLLPLESCIPKKEYVVRLDTTMRLDNNEERGSWPRPDVFVIDRARWKSGNYPLGSPQLAIEVLSDSTEVVDREVKPPRYLAAGSLAVWLVDGRGGKRIVTVKDQTESADLTIGDFLHLQLPLGGATIPVADIFAET